MIEMFYPAEDYVWNAAGLVHVNNRIKEMMENFLEIYFDLYDDSYLEDKPRRDCHIEEYADLGRLRNDMNFSEHLHEIEFAPENGWENSASAFVSLYMLLCVKGVYKANLEMEHILLRLLESELDEAADEDPNAEFECRLEVLNASESDVWGKADFLMSGQHFQVVRVPEPARSFMLYCIEKSGVVEQIREHEDDTCTAEDIIRRYEDIEEYIEWCFEDHDCLLLDDMSKKDLTDSGLVKAMGIHVDGDTSVNRMMLPGVGTEIEFRIVPWETEFVEMYKKSGEKHE